ncbi:hypothetical protein SAMN05421877_1115 [Sphingobacterium lactis]|uniref:Uncharacterized protein n=2 Tax=Sphingobacterium lactis TaxID=797291 RepID=A0A1H6BML5_9SPHI|nr:hypothetical protein SAMN05421877_1115 [Sphingobacterium lactis]
MLFFAFLLIRSGNSHEVINSSTRPAISFMENHLHHDLKLDQRQDQQILVSSASSHGAHGGDHVIISEQEAEDFQLWKDYHLSMAFYACLIAFTFLVFGTQRWVPALVDRAHLKAGNPLFISLRSLRI